MKTKAEKVKIKFQSKNTETYNQPFSVVELKESLNNAHNTAVGPDKIHYQFLKELPKPSTNFFRIFNDLWNSGDIPKIWKETTIILISKPLKDNTNAKNYRPITLSSCIGKTLERMVNTRLIWYLETNKLITEYQSGFRSQRSPMDHLIRLETFIREASIKKRTSSGSFLRSWKSIRHNLEVQHCKRSEKPRIRWQNANIYPKLPSR